MILDEEYDKIKDLKIDALHSEMLSVNIGLWNKMLIKSERLNSVGCVTFVLFMLSLGISFKNGHFAMANLIIFLLAIVYKVIDSKQNSNLKYHGFYEYEICHDRITRYSSAKYRIFHFNEIVKVEDKKIGLLLWKEKPFANFSGLHLMKHTDERLMVIPKSLLSYEQVKKHILKSLEQRT